MNREAIYAALFALVGNAAAFATASRRLRHWTDVPAIEQPALFQVQKSETAKTRRGLPTEWTLAADLYLYCQAPDETTAPATILNPLIDAVVAALAPGGGDLAQNAQTLGSLVSHCWIAGKIETDEGALGGQAVAIIPIELVVAN
jgi:hypothetical protein